MSERDPENDPAVLRGRLAYLTKENGWLKSVVGKYAPYYESQERIVYHLLGQPNFVVLGEGGKRSAAVLIREATDITPNDWQHATKNLCYEMRAMRTHREVGRMVGAVSLDFTRLVLARRKQPAFMTPRLQDLIIEKAGEAASMGRLDVELPDLISEFPLLKPEAPESGQILFGVTTEGLRYLGMQAVGPPQA